MKSIPSNYRGITLTATAAMVYNALLLGHIKREIEKVLRKNQNGVRRTSFTKSDILTIHRIIDAVHTENI